jgi:L-galactose dehydrogenase
MNSMSNIQQNVASLDFKINPELLDELNDVIAPVKNLMWYEGQPENNLPRP